MIDVIQLIQIQKVLEFARTHIACNSKNRNGSALNHRKTFIRIEIMGTSTKSKARPKPTRVASKPKKKKPTKKA